MKRINIGVIILIVIVSLLTVGCDEILNNNNNNNNANNNEEQDNSIYLIGYRPDPGELVGINSKGEVTKSFASYNNYKIGFENYDVYENYLYYIDSNLLYRVDLSKEKYSPEKLFNVSVNWNLIASKDHVYVSGIVNETSFHLYEYKLSDGSERLITNESHNKEHLNITKNQIFYTKENGHLYMQDLNTKKETKLIDESRITYGDNSRLFIEQLKRKSDGSFDYDGTKSFIYDFNSGQLKEFVGNLDLACDYNNSIIHTNGSAYRKGSYVMKSSYDGKSEQIYNFDEATITSIILLKDKFLIKVESGEYNSIVEHYFLDINKKEAVKIEDNTIFANMFTNSAVNIIILKTPIK
jgi:hypothetical protein